MKTLSILTATTLTLALATHAFASVPLDVRVAWAYDGINNPGSYAPNPVPPDYNELKGQFGNQNQIAGDSASNLHDAVAPYGLTGVGVTWDGWRRFNSNNPAAFPADRDWVDRAGSASQLAGNDGGAPTSALVTFTGLLPNDPYKVEVVMTGVSAVPWNVSINSQNADHSFGNTQNAFVGAWNPGTNGTLQSDWLVWDSALSGAGGTMTINFSNAGSGGLDGLHAIRITGMIPEPTSLGLMGAIGVIALSRRGR